MGRISSSLVSGIASTLGNDQFVIVEIMAGGQYKPVYDQYGELMKFTTGDDAARKAREMTFNGRKFQPRRVKNDEWRDREVNRFKTKEYKNLPWSNDMWWKNHQHIWGDHYPHVSQKNSVGLMAFTESDDKGSADVQTAIKPGKYLERYFSNVLDQYVIRDLCTAFSNVFEDNVLIFANTEEEFESFYTSGPSSCMSHEAGKYTSHIHPVRVYAAGDLALVYMKRDGRIVARALCWPERKTYSRVYGDAGRIEPLLSKAGYVKGTPFGAKLQRVLTWENKKNKSGHKAFVVPHIDDCNHVMDCGDHLLIGGGSAKLPGKAVKLVGASGISEWISSTCPKCKSDNAPSSMRLVYEGYSGKAISWCAGCIEGNTFKCEATGALVEKTKNDDNMITMYNGQKWWKRHFVDAGGFTCAFGKDNWPRDHAINIKTDNGIKTVSKTWYRGHDGKRCKDCGHYVLGECTKKCRSDAAATKAAIEKEHSRAVKSFIGTAPTAPWNR